MKNGKDRGIIYWKLNYRSLLELCGRPIGILALALQSITDVLIMQLIHTYVKWKKESDF